MYSVTYTKFNHLNEGCKLVGSARKYSTKREAIAHLRENGFEQLGILDPKHFKFRKLPDILCNDSIRCLASIDKL